jgi:hypothetical protein
MFAEKINEQKEVFVAMAARIKRSEVRFECL